jgi:hypothetical protein
MFKQKDLMYSWEMKGKVTHGTKKMRRTYTPVFGTFTV